MSGIFGDLLLIRIFCFCAYLFMTIFSFSGSLDLNFDWGGHIDPGSLFWGFLGMYVHGSSAVRLFLDERKITLDESEEKEEEALWRFFYRRSGITRLLFKHYVSPSFELVHVKAGTLDTQNWFYIILSGSVTLKRDNETRVTLYSGSSFDIGHLSPAGYFSANDETCDATVISEEAKLFRCSVANLAKLCTHGQVKDAVEGLLISALTDIAKEEYSSAVAPSHDRDAIFAPLEPYEKPLPYLAGSSSPTIARHILFTLKKSFLLPVRSLHYTFNIVIQCM